MRLTPIPVSKMNVGAKTAYQQALDAGRHEALIGMAFLYRRARVTALR